MGPNDISKWPNDIPQVGGQGVMGGGERENGSGDGIYGQCRQKKTTYLYGSIDRAPHALAKSRENGPVFNSPCGLTLHPDVMSMG